MRLRSKANRPQTVRDADYDYGATGSADGADAGTDALPDEFSLLEEGDPRVAPEVVAAFDLFDPLSAKLRSLRSLIFNADDMIPNQPRIVTITGVTGADTPGLAANLAVITAQLGYKGLLVDANFARPTQTALFAVPPSGGVTALMEGDPVDDIETHPTAVPNLDLLPGGPQLVNATELAERVELTSRLRSLRRGYCFMIVDAGTSGEALATALSRGAAGTIIVTERNETPLRAVQSMIHRMASQNVNVLGTLLAR